MGYQTIDGDKKYFSCNNAGCSACNKTESCDRFKQEHQQAIKSANVRLEGQKTLDEIQKYLY